MAPINKRFSGLLPVVIDIETGGLNHETDALLELAAITLNYNNSFELTISKLFEWKINPFEGSNIEQQALGVNGIVLDSSGRNSIAVDESSCIDELFQIVNKEVKNSRCDQAILVGHNPSLDLNFLNAAVKRLGTKNSPFHLFRTIDTATLGVLAYQNIKLALASKAAGFSWEEEKAHTAKYDVTKSAELFCQVFNQWK